MEGHLGGQDVPRLRGKVRCAEWSSGSAPCTLPTAFFSLVLTFFLMLSELTVRLSLPEGWADCPMKAVPKLYLPDLLGYY